jgi:menaquinone-dependent protoporphyrinogen oxidase
VTHILVAYATKNGSTEGVATAIAGTLRDTGCSVDVRSAGEARGPLAGCDLVVLGAPLYAGRWHRDAHRFLRRHRSELELLPVAVFGMGPRSADEEAWRRSRSQLDRALAKRGWLTPIAVAVFGGVDPPKRGGRDRRDLRDWEAIRAWATALPGLVPAPADRASGAQGGR